MKYAVLSLLFVFAVVAGINKYVNNSDKLPDWCPKGQSAVVVGSGRDVSGTITVLYGCDK